ncbi:MAG: SpoIVB peptidase [Bacillota bacterium]|jgi:stage IV sporulation protein B
MQRKYRSWMGIILASLVVLISISPPMRSFYALPAAFKVNVGEQFGLDLQLPQCLLNSFNVEIKTVPENLLNIDKKGTNSLGSFLQGEDRPRINKPGQINLKLKLFGLIPLKKLQVDAVDEIKLYPGGHSIGVLLKTQGVIITGYSPVVDQGRSYLPAKEAGLEIGDIIKEINNYPISSDEETLRLIHELGQKGAPIVLLIQRNRQQIEIPVSPAYCRETGRYRVGLYIRDSAAGVGTLTFFEPNTLIYGALGHVIADAETSQQIAQGEGKIINASIQGIQQARRGQPGEKIGIFTDSQIILGDIQKNTQAGIFGVLKSRLDNELYPHPLPVAFAHQVETGPARMLTVVDQEKIESFAIEITKIVPQRLPSGKNLVIQITDPRLLSLTGGIVQGMSGSPIIQKNRLVGAVTHVFVNEPTKGYGILAEWMLMETDLLQLEEKNKGAA